MKKQLCTLCLVLMVVLFFAPEVNLANAQIVGEEANNFFVHTATTDNTVDYITTLDHPLLDDNPDAVLIVTQNWNPGGVGGTYNDHAFGVYYFGGKWRIYNENQDDLPLNAAFNVYIATLGDTAFTHIHDSSNSGYNETILDHPLLNGQPNETPFSTHYWTPNQVYNTNTTYVGYHLIEERWAIFKEQADEFNGMPENAAFHVVVPGSQHDAFVHEANPSNIISNYTEISHPFLNGNPDAIFFAETNWDNGTIRYLQNTRSNLGVWYSLSSQKWNIFTQDLTAIPEESKFNVLIPSRPPVSEASLTVTPTSAEAGDFVTLDGSGFAPGGYIGTIQWDGVDVGAVSIQDGGSFSTDFEIPFGAAAGDYTISVCALSPCGTGAFEQSAETTVTVEASSGPGNVVHTVYLPVIIGGSGEPTPPTSTPRVEIEIDDTVQPMAESLPGINDGDPARPLGAMSDPDGNVATFVQNEIFVETDDENLIDQIIAEYDGEILLEIDPAAADISDLPKMYLIRVDPTAGDNSKLAEYLDELDTTEGGKISGEHSFSSEEAAGLMAIAGKEAVGGTVIGVNWVGESTTPPDTSAEAGSGGTVGGVTYTRNPYDWTYMNRGSIQDIGSADAWNVLIYGGNWDNRVPYAVLDKGFSTNNDFPDSTRHMTIFPWVTPDGERGGSRSPWHGNHVMQTAMAEADNFYGIAGVAHTVAEPINVYTGYDYVTSIASVLAARAAGAKVINMSYSADVPAIVSFTVLPFEHTTMAVRASGALLFASAGNDYVNVDAERCVLFVCWERTWHTPCENRGVICVGGLEWNSKMRARDVNSSGRTVGGSNWGSDGGVQIFAPYRVYRGADPDNPGNGSNVGLINGTSFSSPYAGGVAALIWAADPSLSAGEVWDIMRTTAHSSPDGSVPRYVNAYAAVREATGTAVSAEITSPTGGTTVDQGRSVSFNADLGAVLNSPATFNYTWTSSRDGMLNSGSWAAAADESGTSASFFTSGLSAGSHTITFSMTGGGFSVTDSVEITIRNTAPTAVIEFPSNNAEVCFGQTINFLGSSFDPNELGGIASSGYSWNSSINGNLGTGNPLPISSLSTGNHTITLTVSDSGGLSQTDTIQLTILLITDPDCTNLKPTASITSPPNGSVFDADTLGDDNIWFKQLTLVGQIDDAEDSFAELTVEWIDSVDGVLGSGSVNTATGVVMITHNFTAEGCGTAHDITLRVTDSDGNVNDIVPHRINISLLC